MAAACLVPRLSGVSLSGPFSVKKTLPRPDAICAANHVEESPDSTRQRCRVTPGGGNPRDSATENRQPCMSG